MKKKIAIIGASYLQLPLIEKAKAMNLETHVFAWAANDVGERAADFFYPISIVEKDTILEKCKEIGIDGICSIASDLAVTTVNYVAVKLGLIGNTLNCSIKSTNKYEMRLCFESNGDPSPQSIKVANCMDLDESSLHYPIIVKPVDRSGSRGVTKLDIRDDKSLADAIEYAKAESFEKFALVEEFIEGQEYSVEYISWKGNHLFLALTLKFTTECPSFIEIAHLQPASVDLSLLNKIKCTVEHALTGLGIEYGASHSEIKIDAEGNIKIIEIGSRMGGDLIGSNLVEMTTGFDFLKAVIDVAMGVKPDVRKKQKGFAAVRFVMEKSDIHVLDYMKKVNPELLVEENVHKITGRKVKDSSTRYGYFLFKSDDYDKIKPYLPW